MKKKRIHAFHTNRIPERIRCGLIVICMTLSCSAAAPQAQKTQKIDCLTTGIALQQAGNHLHAGYWFEAALAQHPENELHILRLLVVSQIHAGRLLAAQGGLERMRQIATDDQGIAHLSALIEETRNRARAQTYTQTNAMEVNP